MILILIFTTICGAMYAPQYDSSGQHNQPSPHNLQSYQPYQTPPQPYFQPVSMPPQPQYQPMMPL
jgi:hypothetical protein